MAHKTKTEKAIDNITKHKVSVYEHELVKTDVVSIYNKPQKWIAKLFKLKLADSYNYCYRVKYRSKGTRGRLAEKDVILNTESRGFYVLKEVNGIAMIVTTVPSVEKPFVHGTFRVVNKSKIK